MTTPFLVVGAMKSGTATVETLLRQHPQVELVAEKESTSFRSRERGEGAARRMRGSRAAAAGEVSTGYMQQPVVPIDPRLAAQVVGPDLRVVAVLREPYARAVSHWRHWEQLGRNESRPMSELILDPVGPYLAFSSYHRQLSPWLDAVGPDRLLTLRLEDYARDPRAWETQLWDFLGTGPRSTDQAAEPAVHENAAVDRVVSGGVGARLRRLSVYRRVLRPLLPSAARRAAARGLGGRVGGSEPEERDATADAFRAMLAEDSGRLVAQWPHLTWGQGQA